MKETISFLLEKLFGISRTAKPEGMPAAFEKFLAEVYLKNPPIINVQLVEEKVWTEIGDLGQYHYSFTFSFEKVGEFVMYKEETTFGVWVPSGIARSGDRAFMLSYKIAKERISELQGKYPDLNCIFLRADDREFVQSDHEGFIKGMEYYSREKLLDSISREESKLQRFFECSATR